ncbi:hypothetical protein BKA70DRAFT_1489434 [Coprinopsis sp. MPI-PUGE-AT-0042]|nr:hypothetical protein BKA70DRAFT_1489434 [Coprinopsis sp. MPI-PUGE-AT-0042]
MSAKTRWVILDDNSPVLNYTGPWAEEPDSSAYLGTLHTTRATNGSRMSFVFNGTDIYLFGIAEWEGEGLETIPFVNCTVDGQNLGSDNRLASKNFNCSWAGEESNDGRPHSFYIEVGIPEGSSGSTSVSIDSLRFLPSLNFGPLNDPHAMVKYQHDDPHINFVSGDWVPWPENWPGNGIMTNGSWSVTKIPFKGTRITWVGRTLRWYDELKTIGQYIVDGGAPNNFIFDPPEPKLPFKVTRIETGALSEGTPHTLEVDYLMLNSPPLSLDYLLVEGGNYLIEAQPPETYSRSQSGGGSTDAVVGSVIGVFLLFGFSFLAWFLAEREKVRNKKRYKSILADSKDAPNLSPHPTVPSSAPDAVSQTPNPIQAPTNTTRLTLSEGANDQRSQSDSMVLQGPQTAHTSALGPSTFPPTSTALQVQGVAAKQGNLSIAGHNVYNTTNHHYHPWGGVAMGISAQSSHIPADDETIGSHTLQADPQHHHRLNEPRANQQAIENHRPTPTDDPTTLNARSEEESRFSGSR